MQICDSFMKDGKCFIACSGPEIVPDLKVKNVAIDDATFNVIKYEIRPSFIGVLQMMLMIDSEKPLPLGECIVS